MITLKADLAMRRVWVMFPGRSVQPMDELSSRTLRRRCVLIVRAVASSKFRASAEFAARLTARVPALDRRELRRTERGAANAQPTDTVELARLRGFPGKRRLTPEPQPQIEAACPLPPNWLSAYAADEWRRVTPQLHALRLLGVLDTGPLT